MRKTIPIDTDILKVINALVANTLAYFSKYTTKRWWWWYPTSNGECVQSIYPAVFAGQWSIYKHITIVNYISSVVNKLGASLTDDASVIIYDRRVFIAQATGGSQ